MSSATKAKRICVVVLGMHRSGTSAIARVLNFLGCDLPANLLDASLGNETGHWEPKAMVSLNEYILASSGSYSHDWLAIPSEWYESPKAPDFVRQAAQVIRTEFGDSRLFVAKDPRLCRVFPLWREALEEAGVTPVVILPLRNPIEVADSLSKRDGFDISWGYLVWLRNVLEAERDSRGVPRFFTTYEMLLDNWGKVALASQAALGIKWPVSLDKAAPNVERFLSKGRRHHVSDPSNVLDNPIMSPWLKDVYGVMLRWAQDGENITDHAVLDRVRSEIENVAPVFGRAVAAGWGAAQWGRQLEQRRVELTTRLENDRQAAAEREKTIEDLSHKLEELETALAETQRRAVLSAKVEEDRDRAFGEAARLTQTLKAAEARLAERFGEIVKLTELLQRAEADRNELAAKLRVTKVRTTELHHRIVEAITGSVRWNFRPRSFWTRLPKAILAQTGLFDADWYRANYPDVAAANIDPLDHFVYYGVREGRHWSHDIANLANDKARLEAIASTEVG